MREEMSVAIQQMGVVRPSTLKRVSLCPWSFKQCLDWESKSEEANRGTMMHEAIWNDETLAKLEEKDRLIVERIREDFVERDKASGFKIFNEVHVVLHDESGSMLTEGTLDYVAITEDGQFARILDFKFGGMPVDKGPFNLQLKAYSAALRQMLSAKDEALEQKGWPTGNISEVACAILQPEISWDIYEEDIGIIDEEEEKKIVSTIESIVWNAYSAKEENAVPGAEQCRFCNKKKCRIWKEACLSALSMIGKDEQSGILAHPGAFLDTKMGKREMMTYADDFLTKVAMLEDAVKQAKEKVSAWVLEQGGSPSFGVVEGRSVKKTDWKGLCESKGITAEEIEGFTSVSKTKPYLMCRTKKSKPRIPNA